MQSRNQKPTAEPSHLCPYCPRVVAVPSHLCHRRRRAFSSPSLVAPSSATAAIPHREASCRAPPQLKNRRRRSFIKGPCSLPPCSIPILFEPSRHSHQSYPLSLLSSSPPSRPRLLVQFRIHNVAANHAAALSPRRCSLSNQDDVAAAPAPPHQRRHSLVPSHCLALSLTGDFKFQFCHSSIIGVAFSSPHLAILRPPSLSAKPSLSGLNIRRTKNGN
ncbi:hypothetical protein M0R45_030617 [Rubus argutus]|uniref:Uncharacterized protein n=1 Tax=Rubus argutus TaxID=59490 RepID=A0AAW1WCE5_RUBAR